MSEPANTATPAGQIDPKVLAKVKIPRKFEIFVEEFDEEGGPGHSPAWKPVKVDPTLGGQGGNPVITVTCPEDLREKMNFYKQIGQRFRIVREIDPPSQELILKYAAEQGIDVGQAKPEEVAQPQCAEARAISDAPNAVVSVPSSVLVAQPSAPRKPKIVTIGDIQLKYDGDKVYQKQWVRLSQTEAANYRVVNDSNNKIFALSGKHIEAKKWVLVEESCEQDTEESAENA